VERTHSWGLPAPLREPVPVLTAYDAGVAAICRLAAQFDDASWGALTPLPEWRAFELAGHLRCRHVTVGARAQEQLAVLDHEELLTGLGRNRGCTSSLDRTGAADHVELHSARADHGTLARRPGKAAAFALRSPARACWLRRSLPFHSATALIGCGDRTLRRGDPYQGAP